MTNPLGWQARHVARGIINARASKRSVHGTGQQVGLEGRRLLVHFQKGEHNAFIPGLSLRAAVITAKNDRSAVVLDRRL